ncbi:MAG: acyl-CoA dehydrogenase family protein [Myxococcales bacterium]|nr:acyl-CoA dehydrogenase family protein [Myxococcales bacterium]
MDFEDTREEAEFRAECRAWLEANASERAPGSEVGMSARDNETVERAQAWQAKKADAGWACITWPREYGGRGATRIQGSIWNQEEARFETPPNLFLIGQGMLGPTLMAHGTEAQQTRYLEKMLRGEEIWCQLFSEPGAGSDLAALRTRAEQDGDAWVINGQKIWTTGAQYSRWGMIVTRTSPGAVKHKGITYFIVDMHAPGVEVRPIKQINGGSSFNEVFFSDVRVPAENMIGRVNEGWRGAITTLMNERAAIGGGGMGGGVDTLVRLAQQVPIDGRPALEDAGVRQRIARLYIRQRGVQLAGLRSLTALSRGETPGPDLSIGKLVGAPLRQEMAAFALELLGPMGAVDDDAVGDRLWQQAYLGAPGGRIAGGTDEIMRNIISERVLGLPPETRVDKHVAFEDVPTGRKS